MGGVRWWLATGVEAERARRVVGAALEQLEEGAVPEKRGRRTALFRLALERDTPDFLLKRNDYAGWAARWRGSKARRELAVAEALAARSVPLPMPLAAG